MILRVLRARVIEGEEARLERYVRDEAIARALKVPGLVSLQPAVRKTRGGTELVVVSTWTSLDDIAAAGNLDAPLSIGGAEPMLVDSRAEHYELVIGQARTMPLRQARLRLTRIPIRPNLEARYYDSVRRWADRLLDEAGLVAFSLGRRVIGRQDDIVAVQVWQDEAALRDAAGSDLDRPMGGDELAQFWAAEPLIEHFEALTAIEPRPDAPAILLADDRRRYVHATPAAARLAGRPLARLLTMRVDDITRPSERDQVPAAFEQYLTEGSNAGSYLLERPDGSEVQIRYASKANAPWPGSHASLLVAEDEAAAADDLDVDEALVAAGLVARYSTR